jgi:hypothetical protein
VLVDPRTTFRECLETIVIAELADHESWRALVRMTSKLDPNMSLEVARAEETEDQHLEKLRAWLSVG